MASPAVTGPLGGSPETPMQLPMDIADYALFVELLSRVGCHVYSGEIDLDGRYTETYTGPGVERFLGYVPAANADRSAAWNSAVHPEDAELYRAAGLVDAGKSTSVEYRILDSAGVVRWVMDQMWVRAGPRPGRLRIDGVVTDITARKQAELELLRLAQHDSLTNLANRLQLEERVRASLTELPPAPLTGAGRGLALLLLDLDGFKGINDTYGHVAGDELLLAAARRISSCLRGDDLAARLGGDEFAIVLGEVDEQGAMLVAERILEAIAAPFSLGGDVVVVTASIGLAFVTHRVEREDLVRDADVAMYQAKAEGRNRIVRFRPVMQERVSKQLQLEGDLRRALAEDQFVLHYQPQFELLGGRCTGVEALVRWQHPERGLLGPGEFTDLAEQTGLIVPLGRWIAETACRDAAPLVHAAAGEPSLAINLSPRQLHDPHIVEILDAAVVDAGVRHRNVTIEITEALLVADETSVMRRLAALRELGVRIAIDDFGTGYSSLAYLGRYPIDILKIDRSFVAPLPDDMRYVALVRSIVGVAEALDLETLAEGVETPEQIELLVELGCHQGQGFILARPQPIAAIAALLSVHR